MDQRQAITYALTGQAVEFYPPEVLDGVPSAAASYRVWDGTAGNAQDTVMSGTATMDTTSLALDASSGVSQTNRRKVNLGSTTGLVVGRRYLLDEGDGRREVVRLVQIVTDDYALVEYDLVFDYTTTARLKGYRQVFTVDADWVADESNLNDPETPYRIEWAYTIASTARRQWTYVDLVRVPKGHRLTEADLLRRDPDLKYQAPRSETGQGWTDFIQAGWERLQFDIDMYGLNANEVSDGKNLDELVLLATRLVIAEAGIAPPGREIEAVIRERFAAYRRDLERAMTGRKLKLAQDKSGAITEPDLDLGFRS